MQLIAPPVNARALCFLSSVAGDALAKHLSKILPAITASLALKLGTSEEDQVGLVLCLPRCVTT